MFSLACVHRMLHCTSVERSAARRDKRNARCSVSSSQLAWVPPHTTIQKEEVSIIPAYVAVPRRVRLRDHRSPENTKPGDEFQ